MSAYPTNLEETQPFERLRLVASNAPQRTTEGPLFDSVREFCRKRGIRFAPRPWRYTGGLV